MEEKDIISQIKEGRTVSKSMVEEVNKDILKNKEDALKRELANLPGTKVGTRRWPDSEDCKIRLMNQMHFRSVTLKFSLNYS